MVVKRLKKRYLAIKAFPPASRKTILSAIKSLGSVTLIRYSPSEGVGILKCDQLSLNHVRAAFPMSVNRCTINLTRVSGSIKKLSKVLRGGISPMRRRTLR
jgi:RNase P/RNase MRP subunit POP5